MKNMLYKKFNKILQILTLIVFMVFFFMGKLGHNVLALDYGESCSRNYSCNSDFCTYDQYVGGHNYDFIENTEVCSSIESDDACNSLSGSCSATFFQNDNNGGESCITTSGLSGVVALNLCLDTITKRCCVPINRCEGNYLKKISYNVDNNGITTTTIYCSDGCVQSGDTAMCRDLPPTLSSLVLKTYDGITVAAETGSRNQMCQVPFRQSSRKWGMQFVINANDAAGVGDVGKIQIRLRNNQGTYLFPEVTSVNGVATIFIADLSTSGVMAGTYNIDVLINDVHAVGSWVDTGRDFKYWNCQVPVSGTIYDGSSNNYFCPNFGNILATKANFTSLFFKQSGGSEGVDNNVSGATYSSKVGSYFIWGDDITYSAQFNSDLRVDTATIDLRLNNSCSQEIGNFKIESVVDPYSVSPNLIGDFLAIVDQDPWFQTINGGVFSKSTITDYVPVTCALSVGCTSAISIGGLVVAPTINSTVGVPYSTPNNWYVKSSAINKINFFEKYKKISGVGITTIEGNLTDNNIINNTNGLLMVNGNVTISQDKETPEGNFLMIVASGDITIEESVTQFDGVLVGNNINVVGTSDEKLTINGSLYGTTRVNIIRNYADKEANNTSPAVVIKFRPDFIFNMPSSMAKKIVNWRWGN